MRRLNALIAVTTLLGGATYAAIGRSEPAEPASHDPPASSLQPPASGLRTGEIAFHPSESEQTLPEHFRLADATFAFRQEPIPTVAEAIEIWAVTFPSPVVTPHPNNNTVHCEYFRPRAAGRYPAVVVLHILGGDFDLSRLFCRQLAHHGVAALFVKLPYYGPRRQPDAAARMVSTNPRETAAGMRQAVLDIRYAAAWLAQRDEVDGDRLGIFGISLGGITGGLAATAEPRFRKVCLLLAGGDVAQISWDSPRLARMRDDWIQGGGTKQEFFDLLKGVDPVTYGANVRGRSILMLNAAHDEVIPKSCTESLWHAFGEPEIVWYDAGHYSAARHLIDSLARVSRFFSEGWPE